MTTEANFFWYPKYTPPAPKPISTRINRLTSSDDVKTLTSLYGRFGIGVFTAHDVKDITTYKGLQKLHGRATLDKVDKRHPITYKIRSEIVARIEATQEHTE